MKKLFLSVGLVAAGTAGLQAAYAPDQSSTDATRMWSVSGTLRGFYDNNYTTSSTQQSSGGFEVSPTFSINVPMQQTEFGMRFIYGLYYYQQRAIDDQNPIDQTLRSDLWLDHAFTERWQARVDDTFIYAQDPDLTSGSVNGLPTRTAQSYFSNIGSVKLTTDWTREFSTVLTYGSDFWDYQNSGGTAIDPSLNGELSRLGNSIGIDFQWHQSPTTVFFIGTQFAQENYTGNEPIGTNPLNFSTYYSDSRNSRSQAVYIGATHNFTPNLAFNGRFGAMYSDYYNDPQNTTSWNPYGNLSLTYTYQPGCFAELGFTETQNPTDVVNVDPITGSITRSQQSSVIYGSINHQITPKLMGQLLGQIQLSTYNGGAYNNDLDTLYSIGLNFTYTFNTHFSAQIGNTYSSLNSQIPGRGYNENEVYAGVTATY